MTGFLVRDQENGWKCNRISISNILQTFVTFILTFLITHITSGSQTEGQAATNYSCGHMAVDYACRKMGATECHIYGFDSIFELDLTSSTDLILESDRGTQNTYRLANNWRPIFSMMFQEFKDTQFYIYHRHKNTKVQLPENVTIKIGGKP